MARTGTHGQKGQTVTSSDLAEIAETFPEIGSAPVAIGHVLADYMPAFGKVTSVRFNPSNNTLEGEVELNDLAEQAYQAGYYPSWSIGAPRRATDGKRYLHHLALLGGQPPAVKDLKELGLVQLSDISPEDNLSINNQEEGPMGSEAAKNNKGQTGLEDIQAKNAALEAEIAKLKEHQATERDKQLLADTRAENQQLKKLLRERQKDALVKAAEGRIPADKLTDLKELADVLPEGDVIELSDPNGAKEKLTPLELLARILGSIPAPVQEGELDLSDEEDKKTDVFEGLTEFA